MRTPIGQTSFCSYTLYRVNIRVANIFRNQLSLRCSPPTPLYSRRLKSKQSVIVRARYMEFCIYGKFGLVYLKITPTPSHNTENILNMNLIQAYAFIASPHSTNRISSTLHM